MEDTTQQSQANSGNTSSDSSSQSVEVMGGDGGETVEVVEGSGSSAGSTGSSAKPTEGAPSINNLDKMLGEGVFKEPITEKSKTKDEVKETKSVTGKEVAQATAQTKKPSDTQKLGEQPLVKDTRSYEGFSPEETKLLKSASNETYSWATKTIRELRVRADENKALKEKVTAFEQGRPPLPESYYSHPQAYTLTPEYSGLVQGMQRQQTVIQHWEEQALRIEKGEEWEDLSQDDKGNIYKVKAQPASAEAKIAVFNYLAQCQRNMDGYRGDLSKMQAEFGMRHTQLGEKLKSAAEQYFPSLTREATPEMKQHVANTVEWMDKQGLDKGNQLFNLLALSVTQNLLLRGHLLKLTEGQQTAAQKAAEDRKAGPNGSSFAGGSGQKGDGDKPKVTLQQMSKLLGE